MIRREVALVMAAVVAALALSASADGGDLDDAAIARKLAGTDRAGKVAALGALARRGTLAAVKQMFALAADDDPEVREALLAAIVAPADLAVVGWLATDALAMPQPEVRAVAVEALGRHPAVRRFAQSEKIIEGLMLKDPDPRVTVAAVRAYGRLELAARPEPVYALLDAARPLAVRRAAVEALLAADDDARPKISLAAAAGDPDLALRGLAWSRKAFRFGRWFAPWPVEGARRPDRFLWTAHVAMQHAAAKTRGLGIGPPEAAESFLDILRTRLHEGQEGGALITALGEFKETNVGGYVSFADAVSPPARTAALRAHLRYRASIPGGGSAKSHAGDQTDWRLGALYRVWYDLELPPTTPPRPRAALATRGPRRSMTARFASSIHVPPDLPVVLTSALNWLADHQELDGRWSCSGNNPYHDDLHVPGFADEDAIADTSATGLALLAFFSAGEAPGTNGPFREHLDHALDWLAARQGEGGVFRDPAATAPAPAGTVHGSRRPAVEDYNHCIAALALVEAAAMSGDERWKAAAQRGLDAIVNAPRAEGRAWSGCFSLADVGFAVFAILALTEGRAAGLAVPPEVLRDARAYVEMITDPATGQVAYQVGHPQCLAGLDGTAALLVARRALGLPAGDPANVKAAAWLAGHPPLWEAWFDLPAADPVGTHFAHLPTANIANFFFWRFAALGARAQRPPGGPLDPWCDRLRTLLIDHQRLGGDEDGSWDPVGVWARVGGRVYSTTMAVLALTADSALDFDALAR